jgi:ATP-dependent Clp protease ATP-binding subunit ClpB
MTSNLGAEYLVNLSEDQDVDAVRDEVMNVVKASFRPEFLNRVDEVILFHRLRRKDMDRIVEIQLQRLEALLADRKIRLDLDADAIEWLAGKGYEPVYGARPLKRVMQKELQDPLAEKILGGEILDGSTVKVTSGSDRLNFRSKPTVVEEAEKAA